MAYSMFDCPKLHNAKSLKFYPEEHDHISFRHKALPPDSELLENPNFPEQCFINPIKKCPIYVHNYDGDYAPKARKKSKKTAIEKLEETYWANWKPEKPARKISGIPPLPVSKSCRSPEIQVIKSAPPNKRKIKLYPCSDDNIIQKSSKSQEIQTDEILVSVKEIEPPLEEEKEIPVEEINEDKFLKHTDSLILNLKKNKEEKEHFEQPKCIRLYKKSTKGSSRNVIKGGSYPLKSCLKKESTGGTKNASRFGRPGSPMIVSSHYKGKHGKFHNKH